MQTFTAESLAGLSWDDAEFRGFRWSPNQEDVILLLATPSLPGGALEVECRWVTSLRITLDYAETAGALLSWSGEITRTGNAWNVAMEFPGHGSIALTCNDLSASAEGTSSGVMTGDWPFEARRDTAVITTVNVLEGSEAVLVVIHDSDDGGWQFLCGKPRESSDARVIALEEAVTRDPTLRQLADLPVGWRARRDARGSPWRREPNPPALDGSGKE